MDKKALNNDLHDTIPFVLEGVTSAPRERGDISSPLRELTHNTITRVESTRTLIEQSPQVDRIRVFQRVFLARLKTLVTGKARFMQIPKEILNIWNIDTFSDIIPSYMSRVSGEVVFNEQKASEVIWETFFSEKWQRVFMQIDMNWPDRTFVKFVMEDLLLISGRRLNGQEVQGFPMGIIHELHFFIYLHMFCYPDWYTESDWDAVGAATGMEVRQRKREEGISK